MKKNNTLKNRPTPTFCVRLCDRFHSSTALVSVTLAPSGTALLLLCAVRQRVIEDKTCTGHLTTILMILSDWSKQVGRNYQHCTFLESLNRYNQFRRNVSEVFTRSYHRVEE